MRGKILKNKAAALAAVFILFASLFLQTPYHASAAYDCFTIIAGEKKYKFSDPEIVLSADGYSMLSIDSVVDKIYLDTMINAKDAQIIFSPNSNEKFAYENEYNGKCVDRRNLKAQIEYALLSGKNSVKARFIDLLPDISAKDLAKKTRQRSVFKTFYGYSSAERKSNIALACSSVSGFVLHSGEQFSFNDAVGARTEKRGYKPAKIIMEGKFVEGTGGGVCQVSTTLYNAALIAGLEIKECHRHSLAVGYVEPSFDAMVNAYVCDLKFYNGTGDDVYIAMNADGAWLSAEIYGVERLYEYKRQFELLETIAAKEITVEDDTLEIGKSLVVTRPKNGMKSIGYLYLYKDGNVVQIKKLREDFYKPLDGETRVGTMKKDSFLLKIDACSIG